MSDIKLPADSCRSVALLPIGGTNVSQVRLPLASADRHLYNGNTRASSSARSVSRSGLSKGVCFAGNWRYIGGIHPWLYAEGNVVDVVSRRQD